ncbi:hypothetical protein SAMN00017405_0893 [Desulfonispora thiosulfatigenes DSM 11270]|uniref:Uncharacterized protein n=1 Tax=Desulfonispora thiosulfatigenes DSM 11270 TaxID=656914 RepID=A0A1W1UIC0_DESTI|nr:hypothetical protein [Desulfonispora thiosulfatigenes]SMB80514.1 hypothetical protein SAMN00017405_0893 [Desulfonispora thiosulfatigenes DSM 11270]
MKRDKKTPFDREGDEKILLKLIVHSESLSEEIINSEPEVEALIELSQFPFVEVIFTPTNNKEVREILKNNYISLTEYKRHNNVISIESENFGHVIFGSLNPKHMEKDFSQAVVSNSKVNYLDLFTGHDEDYDFFIINTNDPFYVSKLRKEKDIEPKYAIELARILFINKGLFYIAPNYIENSGKEAVDGIL